MSPAASAPFSWKKRLARWLPIVVVGVGCVYVARTVNLHDLAEALLGVRVAPLLFAVALAALGVVAHAGYWTALVRTAAPVTLRAMTTYTFASYATNTFLPMRAGEALRVWMLQRRHGVAITLSGAVIALEKIADVSSLLVLVSPLPWLLPDLPSSVARALRVLPCIVAVAVAAVVIASKHAVRWKLLEGFRVLRKPAAITAGFTWIFGAWLLDVATILTVLAAVHIEPTLDKALVVLLMVNLAIAIPATPGQVGTHELGSTVGLRLVGIPEAQAIPFALFYHATQLVPVLLFGFASARALSSGDEAPRA